jgi:hypothetical protein
MKIILILLVLVLFGVMVGSNLSVMMTVVVLNQPTMALPIGIWLVIAVGLGLISSISIQLLLFLQRRSATKKIRQLQTRLQERDEDFFTYTSSPEANPEAKSAQKTEPPLSSRNRFSFRRTRTQPTPNQSDVNNPSPTPTKPSSIIDDDDWEDEPRSNRQLDWDDVPPPQTQTPRASTKAPIYSNFNSTEPQREESRSTQNRSPEIARNDEVYDADFRLIQPPYKQPPEEAEELEYIDQEDEYAEEYPTPINSDEPTFTKQSNRQKDLDLEDWGFDFDDEDAEVNPAKLRTRKN